MSEPHPSAPLEPRQVLHREVLKAVSPFLDYLGIDRIELGEGSSRVYLEVRPHHTNRAGTTHGGVLASLLDVAVGSAATSQLDSDHYVITVSLTVDYLQAGRKGDTLVAEARILRKGARMVFVDAAVRNEERVLLARSSAVLVVHRRNERQG